MRWAKNSFFSWLNSSAATPAIEVRMDEIRAAMLACLASCGPGKHPHLAHRLKFAPDIAALWYARSDLMRALAASQGESMARAHIAGITLLFEGLLPGSATSRPSPLSSQ